MSPRNCAIPTIVIALAVLAGACGDDGNDRARRAAELADEYRATRTTNVQPDAAPTSTAPSTGLEESEGGADEVAPTVAVTPTGVVVPVVALDNSFRPIVVEITVGDEIVWENRGLNEHDVLRVDGEGWGVEVDAFQPGDVYAHVFTEPGEYRYFCSIHGNEDVGMTGTVIVTG